VPVILRASAVCVDRATTAELQLVKLGCQGGVLKEFRKAVTSSESALGALHVGASAPDLAAERDSTRRALNLEMRHTF
jgi:hypothetical protein